MLLVLALVWGAFLVWWLRSRAQGTFGDSVGTFRRHLRVLERTAPSTVRPANRLRGPVMVPAYRPPPGIQGPPRPASGYGRRPMAVGGVVGNDVRRRQALKRRRDVLFVLLVAVVATLVMAGATRASALVFLQVVSDLALVGYIGLLVRLRNLAAERDLKLSYLPPQRLAAAHEQAHLDEMPGAGYAAARRRSSGRAIAHSDPYGSGYGQLAMRRAAN